MAIQLRSILKGYFTTGSKPTEDEFGDLIDSFYHRSSDEIPSSSISGLQALLDEKISEAPTGEGITYGRKDSNWVAIEGFIESSADLELATPAEESVSGVEQYVSGALVGLVSKTEALQEEIAAAAAASVTVVADPTGQAVSTTESILTISKGSEPTDDSIISVDEINDSISIYRAGRYFFGSNLIATNSSNSTDETLTIRTRDTEDDEIFSERYVECAKDTPTPDFEYVEVVVEEGDLPLTLNITVESTGTNLEITSFNTVLSTGGSVVVSGGLAVTAKSGITGIRSLSTYSADVNIFDFSNGYLYSYDSTNTNDDDGDTYLKPDDIDSADAGRWVKQAEFALKSDISGGTASKRDNTTEVISTDAATTTLDNSLEKVRTLDFDDGITTHTIAMSNLSTEESYNTLVIDNKDNTSDLVVTFDNASDTITYRNAKNDFPGTYPDMNVTAGEVWEIDFQNRSATLVVISFLEGEDN